MYTSQNTAATTKPTKGSKPRSNTLVYVTLRIVGKYTTSDRSSRYSKERRLWKHSIN